MSKTYDVRLQNKILSGKEICIEFTNDKNWWQTIKFDNFQQWLNFKKKIENIHKDVLKVRSELDE